MQHATNPVQDIKATATDTPDSDKLPSSVKHGITTVNTADSVNICTHARTNMMTGRGDGLMNGWMMFDFPV